MISTAKPEPERIAESEHTATIEQATHETRTTILPISVLLLLLMAYSNLWITDRVPGLDWFQATLPRVLMIALVIAYLLIIWIVGPTPKRRAQFRARLWRTTIAVGLIGINIVLPTTQFIGDRLQRGPYPNNVIDWPLQIEAGSRLLLQGKSPYGADYSLSEMGVWSERANFPTNPAQHHAIHLPINFLLGAITLPPWQALTGWYDARIILIAAYLVVLLLAPRLAGRWEDGHALLIGLALNPLLVDWFAVGLSDYLLIAWLVLALYLRRQEYPRAAAAILGLAVATRQFAWFLVPLYIAAEYFAWPEGNIRTRARALTLRIWPLFIVPAAVIMPFLVANPQGFYEDVIAFGSGGIADAYPIGGPKTFGLSVIVLGLGWAKSTDQFPFTLLQLAVTLPLIGYSIWSQHRSNTLRHMLFGYLLTLSVFLFTGRFMHANYIGFLFALLLMTAFIAETPLGVKSDRTRSSPASHHPK